MKIKLHKLTKKIVCKSKEEWLSKRVIGGTTISAIMGKSKWATANDVYNELVKGIKKKVQENDRIATGKANEPIIVKLFANDFGKQYEIKETRNGRIDLYYRKDKPYITCSPDRLMIEKTTGDLVGLEIKDVEVIRKDDMQRWIDGYLPENYLYQCLWYFVTFPNMKRVILFPNIKFYTFDGKEKTYDYSMHKQYILEREECLKLIDDCERAVDDFWTNHILKKVRPQRVIHI